MNQSLALDIDYGFKEEYTVLFEIYDQDPIEVNDKDGSWKKKEVEPFIGLQLTNMVNLVKME